MKKVADKLNGFTIGYRFIDDNGAQLFYCNFDSDREYGYRWNLYAGDDVLKGFIEAYPTLKEAFQSVQNTLFQKLSV